MLKGKSDSYFNETSSFNSSSFSSQDSPRGDSTVSAKTRKQREILRQLSRYPHIYEGNVKVIREAADVLRPRWKQRFCVLYKHQLAFYRVERQIKSVEELIRTKEIVMVKQFVDQSREFALQIATVDMTLVMHCPSRESWVEWSHHLETMLSKKHPGNGGKIKIKHKSGTPTDPTKAGIDVTYQRPTWGYHYRKQIKSIMIMRVLSGPQGVLAGLYKWPKTGVGSVGRSVGSNVLSLPKDLCVSRHHFRLEVIDNIPYVSDLGTKSGTFLNGVRVVGSYPLKPGDNIELGQTKLVFEITDPKKKIFVQNPLPSGEEAPPFLKSSPPRKKYGERSSLSVESVSRPPVTHARSLSAQELHFTPSNKKKKAKDLQLTPSLQDVVHDYSSSESREEEEGDEENLGEEGTVKGECVTLVKGNSERNESGMITTKFGNGNETSFDVEGGERSLEPRTMIFASTHRMRYLPLAPIDSANNSPDRESNEKLDALISSLPSTPMPPLPSSSTPPSTIHNPIVLGRTRDSSSAPTTPRKFGNG